VDHGPTQERTNPKKGSDIHRFIFFGSRLGA